MPATHTDAARVYFIRSIIARDTCALCIVNGWQVPAAFFARKAIWLLAEAVAQLGRGRLK